MLPASKASFFVLNPLLVILCLFPSILAPSKLYCHLFPRFLAVTSAIKIPPKIKALMQTLKIALHQGVTKFSFW